MLTGNSQTVSYYSFCPNLPPCNQWAAMQIQPEWSFLYASQEVTGSLMPNNVHLNQGLDTAQRKRDSWWEKWNLQEFTKPAFVNEGSYYKCIEQSLTNYILLRHPNNLWTAITWYPSSMEHKFPKWTLYVSQHNHAALFSGSVVLVIGYWYENVARNYLNNKGSSLLPPAHQTLPNVNSRPTKVKAPAKRGIGDLITLMLHSCSINLILKYFWAQILLINFLQSKLLCMF